MDLNFFKQSRFLIAVQLFFVYTWLVILQHTDSYYSVYLLIAVLGCFAMHHNYQEKNRFSRRFTKCCGVAGVILSTLIFLANYFLFTPWSSLLNLVNAGCCLAGGGILFYHILFYGVRKLPMKLQQENRNGARSVFLISFAGFAVIYLCYLYFLSYPGLVSWDSMSAIKEIFSGQYSNTLPFWHTHTVGVFFRMGYTIFGDINAAIAFYLTFQVIFMAACFAYAIVTLYQIGIPNILVATVAMIFGIVPFHAAYSVTLWKDVIFSGAALLFVTALYRVLKHTGNPFLNELVLVLGAAGLSLWRTNGWYAVAATVIIITIILGKDGKRLLGILWSVVIVCGFMIGPLLYLWDIPKTGFVEPLGIPFQQIARVVASDCELTDQDEEMLSEIFDLEKVKELYDPQIVDPIKFEAFRKENQHILKDNFKEYVSLWMKLGLRYPGAYLQAWIDITKGYWNGGYEYWIYMYSLESNNDLGIVASGGGNVVARVFRAVARYLEKPEFLKPLYSIGLHVWMVAICCFLCVLQNRKEYIISIPILVLVAGLMIGTPVFAEFRYAYPVFTTAPLIACVTAFDRR